MSRGGPVAQERVLVEICVGDVASAEAAQAGGAFRVELCDHLAVGGTTPSAGAIALACRRLSIPVHVLIRPRAGDFVYSELELAVMRHDIEVANSLGAAGIAIGVLTARGTVDRKQMASLAALARPLSLTFHKAFDQVSDHLEALDILLDLGFDRVLTSGGRPTALEGVEMLAALVERARGRLAVMAGGRLDADSLPRVIRQGKVNEVHLGSAVTETAPGTMTSGGRDGSKTSWQRVDTSQVVRILARVNEVVAELMEEHVQLKRSELDCSDDATGTASGGSGD
jgi:copper homeostasis protein